MIEDGYVIERIYLNYFDNWIDNYLLYILLLFFAVE